MHTNISQSRHRLAHILGYQCQTYQNVRWVKCWIKNWKINSTFNFFQSLEVSKAILNANESSTSISTYRCDFERSTITSLQKSIFITSNTIQNDLEIDDVIKVKSDGFSEMELACKVRWMKSWRHSLGILIQKRTFLRLFNDFPSQKLSNPLKHTELFTFLGVV